MPKSSIKIDCIRGSVRGEKERVPHGGERISGWTNMIAKEAQNFIPARGKLTWPLARSLCRGSPNALVTAIPPENPDALRNNFDGEGGEEGERVMGMHWRERGERPLPVEIHALAELRFAGVLPSNYELSSSQKELSSQTEEFFLSPVVDDEGHYRRTGN